MSRHGNRKKQQAPHPYLAGNFAPVTKTTAPIPVTSSGDIPKELHGGMYVRNGGNPITNSDLGRSAHWFDGDGMLTGVWFKPSSTEPHQSSPHFVNQFILTDLCISSFENEKLQTPILPSIATLVNPMTRLIVIICSILRSAFLVLLSHLPGSQQVIKRISVANTSILYHDGRALATCESGPPIRVQLPGLETVGWFNGNAAEGEFAEAIAEQEPGFGGIGMNSWMREWTTGHPKVDLTTGEMMLFHCSFLPPFVHYSVIPREQDLGPQDSRPGKMLNTPIPGCSGGKMMHDFGVSKHHSVILDLPLSLSPFNLIHNKSIVAYEPERPSRFGVFPRRDPGAVRWFETIGCCIFHTANTWDEASPNGEVTAVNMLACRLTSASLVFSAGNLTPPPHPNHQEPSKPRPMSFFARYGDDENSKDMEQSTNEKTPLVSNEQSLLTNTSPVPPISVNDEEQCRLYYYRFDLSPAKSNTITYQFALSTVPFEFPTVSPHTEMRFARYIYGCSTSNASFGAALGKGTKIDVIVKMDIQMLLVRAQQSTPENVTGSVDNRSVQSILSSNDPDDAIKAFKLPPQHYAQEARFVPSSNPRTEDDGYLLFYVFDESQLDELGECRENATSDLWVLDSRDMQAVVCRIQLPRRVPYGLHGNWFSSKMIRDQRAIEKLRSMPVKSEKEETAWGWIRRRSVDALG